MKLLESLGLHAEMVEKLRKAAEIMESHEGIIHVISHYDSDGLAAAAVIGRTLYRKDKQFVIDIRKSLVSDDIPQLMEEDKYSSLIIMSDMGSAYMEDIAAIIEETPGLDRKFIILDHHVFSGTDGGNIININARQWGYDGSKGVCGATTAMLFSLAVSDDNADLLPIALAGAYGDKQAVGGWTGINASLVELGLKGSFLRYVSAPHIFGETIVKGLAMSNDPFLSGISGSYESARNVLELLGIPSDVRVEALLGDDAESKKRIKMLNSYILAHLVEQGVQPEVVKTAVMPRLFGGDKSVCPDGDVEKLNHIANACGRERLHGLALGMYMGDNVSYAKAIEVWDTYRMDIQNALMSIQNGGAVELDHIQYFHAPPGEDTMCGSIAGLAMEYILRPDKPTIGLASGDDGTTKVSARANASLVKRGVNLAEAMKMGAEPYGGNGGGHPIAAGATIPTDSVENFLKTVDEIIGRQLEGEGNAS